jgi:hypothetical protein
LQIGNPFDFENFSVSFILQTILNFLLKNREILLNQRPNIFTPIVIFLLILIGALMSVRKVLLACGSGDWSRFQTTLSWPVKS